MDKFLLFSILLVFIGAFFSSVLQQRRKDRVLKDLDGFQVIARLKKKDVWGCFRSYPNAIELIFSRPYRNRRDKTLTSYIMFSDMMKTIEVIFRFHDELSPVNQKRRLKEIKRVANPDILHRAGRMTRNFLVAFQEAIGESIGILLTRAQKHMPMKGDEKRMQKLGAGSVSFADNMAYEAVLENYIAHRVVVEIRMDDDSIVEYEGYLKEYSADWMSIVGCQLDEESQLPLRDANRLMLQRVIDFHLDLCFSDENPQQIIFRLQLTNKGNKSIQLCQIEDDNGYQHQIGSKLSPEESIAIELTDLPEESLVEIDRSQLPLSLPLIAPERIITESGTAQKESPDSDEEEQESRFPALPNVTLVYYSTRAVDVYVPRSHGLIRHGGEYVDARRKRHVKEDSLSE
ncbi:MAG: hypothetical protein IZT60_04030 [Gammaproteobacteria bacterium]|nr:hypothetical protein [Gammaproteobacteria bacterium]